MNDDPTAVADKEGYSVTLKAGKGFEDPWLVIRAGTIELLHDRVKAAQQSGIFATIGSSAKDLQAAYQLGNKLGAEPIAPPAEPKTPAKKAPAKKAPAKAAQEAPEAPSEAPEAPAATEAPVAAKPAAGGRPKPAWRA